MYYLRLKIFIFLCIIGLVIIIGRLWILQTQGVQSAREKIADMRILPAKQCSTIRGKILDRYDRPLALDEPAFYLYINYELTCHRDDRWKEGRILRELQANEDKTRAEVEQELAEDWKDPIERLNRAIDLADELTDVPREEILEEIDDINNRIWEIARWISWRRKNPGQSRNEYLAKRDRIPLEQIVGVNLREMYGSYPLVELEGEKDLLKAQVELVHLDGLEIKPQAKRSYPFGSAACQLIGWVAPAAEKEMDLFEGDEYREYLPGEGFGKLGIERVYEPVLRGRRGEAVYDRQGNLLEKTEPQYGRDVQLTIDIELQQKIEKQLAAPGQPHGQKLCAAVVLEAARNDILAMASIPVFDLNTIRLTKNYNRIFNPNDPNKLWEHKALQRNYPPGSTVKPLILTAAMEDHKISSGEAISCPSAPPPEGWPRCILQRDHGVGHDDQFISEGGNIARNAIRGSCNVYFSRLAHRLDTKHLQQWLFNFGYGQDVLPTPMPNDLSISASLNRRIPQAHGNLIFGVQKEPSVTVSDLSDIPNSEKRWWGMGQGNLRVTVLQAANALSAIVRNGVYKSPRLIYDDQDPFNDKHRRQIPISSRTLSVIRDGMHAVIYESHGTAERVFDGSELLNRGMTLYGKTGSTEKPEHAWFECFAEDSSGRAIVIVVLVERGARGAGEAAPLGKEILRLCNEAGYIGVKP